MLRKFKPFLTGSHAYGIPGPKSDIDLVVLVNEDELGLLEDQADFDKSIANQTEDANYTRTAHTRSLRFGKLNLLCCKEEKVFEAWRIITWELKKKAPVPRDFAVEYMGKRREELLG